MRTSSVFCLILGLFAATVLPVHGFIENLYCGKANCYEVLQVTKEASKDEIGKSYRQLARKNHPDRFRTAEEKKSAEERFRLIATAYETLKDDDSRADYNYMLDNPDEYYQVYYRYYRRRVSPKVDIKVVVLVCISVITAIQYFVLWSRYNQAINYLARDPKYRARAIQAALSEGTWDVDVKKRKGRSKEEIKEEEDAAVRLILESKMDIKGGYAKPTYRDLLWVQIVYLPCTTYQFFRWYVRWGYRYIYQKLEYEEEDKIYLIRRNLKLSQTQFDALSDKDRAEIYEKELWCLENAKIRAEEERKAKEADKQARKELLRQKAEVLEAERRAAVEREREAQRLADEAAKQESEKLRKEREADSKILKKERKILRDLLKGWDYFSGDRAKQLIVMQDIERLCEALSAQELQELNQKMTSGNVNSAQSEFAKLVDALVAAEKAEAARAAEREEVEEREGRESALKQQSSEDKWSDEEHRLLIRAMTQFPVGTRDRWDVVAEFINHHVFLNALTQDAPRKKKLAKDVIAKMKNLKLTETSHEAQRMGANNKAFDKFVQKQKPVLKPEKDDSSISENFDEESAARREQPDRAWSSAEQTQLEQCLKKYPASDEKRFENIAGEMGSRTAEECRKRFKELVAKIKAQKAAAGTGK
ncbi:DnaJ-like protein subfamily C member 25 [Hypsibius exemplaris]|uniref:DnaJ-like protein subfamily C member 25 n=1 Tax=Hypsibius exemplaris TaxID=2072580 RepID=A0A1W0WTZ3_HYPEX|nr:DnaJ-like protein subfamily C member 25 [Hypsibius exemplaris]